MAVSLFPPWPRALFVGCPCKNAKDLKGETCGLAQAMLAMQPFTANTEITQIHCVYIYMYISCIYTIYIYIIRKDQGVLRSYVRFWEFSASKSTCSPVCRRCVRQWSKHPCTPEGVSNSGRFCVNSLASLAGFWQLEILASPLNRIIYIYIYVCIYIYILLFRIFEGPPLSWIPKHRTPKPPLWIRTFQH